MFVFIIKGCSGSGKSTRVSKLLSLLSSKGMSLKDVTFTNIEGKVKNIGILVEELNLIVIGKYYVKNNETRFQGFDSVTSAFCGVTNFSDYLKENSNKYSYIIEGAGITDSYRFRPKYLKEIGFENIFVQYYTYKDDQKDQYLKRIFDRTGKHPSKDSGWNKRNNFRGDLKFSVEDEIELSLSGVPCLVLEDPYDTDIDDFSYKFMNIFEA